MRRIRFWVKVFPLVEYLIYKIFSWKYLNQNIWLEIQRLIDSKVIGK